jgi:HrpA-like RNA helicase
VCSEDEETKTRRATEAAKLSKRERIRAQREALPSYAYKDQFIQAVFDHQVRCPLCTILS